LFFREFFRSLFSANLFVTGIILTIAAVVLFYGSIYLFNYTNLGKRLGFLVTGAAVFGWFNGTGGHDAAAGDGLGGGGGADFGGGDMGGGGGAE